MRSPNERLFEVLKKNTTIKLNVSDIEIQNVRVNDNTDIFRNTRCLLLARPNGKLRGTMEFYYNRLDLRKVFHGMTPTLIYNYGERVTTQQLAERLGKDFGLELYGDDVEQSGEIYLTRFPQTVRLEARPGSYCVTGYIDVELAETGTDLTVAMGVTTLSGLNPPNGDFRLIQGCLYSWEWVAQPDLAEILRSTPVGDKVPPEVAPYLTALDGQRTWGSSSDVTEANIHDASLVYLGNRDNHPDYGNGMRRDEIAVIRLNDSLNSEIGGELVIGLP